MENCTLHRQPAQSLDQLPRRRLSAPNSGSRNLNDRKLCRAASNRISSATSSGSRSASAAAGDIRAIVAGQQAAATGLNQRSGKLPEIVPQPKTPRPKRRPIGQRQAIEIRRPIRTSTDSVLAGQHFVQLPVQLLGFAAHQRRAAAGKCLRQMPGQAPTTSTRGRGCWASTSAMAWRLQIERHEAGLKTYKSAPAGVRSSQIFHPMSGRRKMAARWAYSSAYRPLFAADEIADDHAGHAASGRIAADTETAGKILADSPPPRVPQHNMHAAFSLSSRRRRNAQRRCALARVARRS